MSEHLRTEGQRWLLKCDRIDCANVIVADEATHAKQREQLEVLAEALHWRRTTDAGDFCGSCSEVFEDPLPPLIPREELCGDTVACLLKHGHQGKCRVVPRSEHQRPDYGPEPGGPAWSMSRRRIS